MDSELGAKLERWNSSIHGEKTLCRDVRGSWWHKNYYNLLLSHTMTGKNRHTSFVNRLNFKSCIIVYLTQSVLNSYCTLSVPYGRTSLRLTRAEIDIGGTDSLIRGSKRKILFIDVLYLYSYLAAQVWTIVINKRIRWKYLSAAMHQI